jgi:hypothetical protein
MFLKKLVFCSLFSVIVFSLAFTVNSPAQERDLDEITVDDLNKEGPLTQADIALFLKYVDLSQELAKEMKQNPNLDFKSAAMKFVKENGVSTIRFRYILEKVPYGSQVVAAKDPQAVPAPSHEYLKLSEPEKELLTTNQSKILGAFGTPKK